ncbi:hypothetical protein [uncultured Microbulbifer sp.]|uniref:hypothetical protein n=1 Tax=uncultured Microbulbifer sp. TaxID=348147 RepID=UPI00261CD1C4|nr:hypothetical protein [uncultured Microbulbifer sp.]
MTKPSPNKLALKLPASLSALHQEAAQLAEILAQQENATRPWQHYLLQPTFAQFAAEQLGHPFDTPFRLAAALLARLDYEEEPGHSDARNTLQIPGLLAVPPQAITQAQALNKAKAEFQNLTTEIKAALAPRPTLERDRQLREMLADAGYPRAHLRQCYRQVLLCPEKPDALTLSWIKARKSIRKVTVDWCERKLVQLDAQGQDTGIQYQRQLLADLPGSRHQSLRQVQIQSRPNLQVAEIFRNDEEEQYRQVGYSAMPVLVHGGKDRLLPDFTRVDHNPPTSQRRTRRDLKIEKTPFLAALRVHLVSE